MDAVTIKLVVGMGIFQNTIGSVTVFLDLCCASESRDINDTFSIAVNWFQISIFIFPVVNLIWNWNYNLGISPIYK